MQITAISRLNAGGQGEVWRGRTEDGAPVAIKYLHQDPDPLQAADDRHRFQREITCQVSLRHEGVMPVLARNLHGDRPFYVMPLAERSLRDMLDSQPGGLDEDEALEIFAKIAAAMAFAHSEGVVHRDLKPENILFLNGEPRLSDFGLGRRLHSGSTTLTMTNALLGTFVYAAPEQFTNAHEADERADVFALGRILYEMLSGQYAFPAMNMSLVPAKLHYIIMRATRHEPERRYASAGELWREITLFTDSSTDLLAPSETAKNLSEQISAGDHQAAEELCNLFIRHPDDLQLYLQVLPYFPVTTLQVLADEHPEEFVAIIATFDGYADGGHPFSFTDTLADFMAAVFRVSDDIDTRELLLRRILRLGASHNRWYIRGVFVRLVIDALKDVGYAQMVADILTSDDEGREFVRPEFTGHSLPRIVHEALRRD